MRNEDRKDKVAVVVGTITNDLRLLDLPKLKVSIACDRLRVEIPSFMSPLTRSVPSV